MIDSYILLSHMSVISGAFSQCLGNCYWLSDWPCFWSWVVYLGWRAGLAFSHLVTRLCTGCHCWLPCKSFKLLMLSILKWNLSLPAWRYLYFKTWVGSPALPSSLFWVEGLSLVRSLRTSWTQQAHKVRCITCRKGMAHLPAHLPPLPQIQHWIPG